MIRTKMLQFFICYKMSDLKVPKYLFTSFFKVLSQIFIKASLFVHIFTTQLLFSFHEIFVSVTNYHAGFLVRFFYSKISIICWRTHGLSFLTVKIKVCLFFLTFLQISNKSFSTLLNPSLGGCVGVIPPAVGFRLIIQQLRNF